MGCKAKRSSTVATRRWLSALAATATAVAVVVASPQLHMQLLLSLQCAVCVFLCASVRCIDRRRRQQSTAAAKMQKLVTRITFATNVLIITTQTARRGR